MLERLSFVCHILAETLSMLTQAVMILRFLNPLARLHLIRMHMEAFDNPISCLSGSVN